MARTLRVMNHACHRVTIYHALMTWRIPARRRAPEGRFGTEGRGQAQAAVAASPGVGGGVVVVGPDGRGGAALDLGGERGVVLGAAAVRGVLEDRLAEARALGQADVAPDPRPEQPGVGPGRRRRASAGRRRSSSRSSITSPPWPRPRVVQAEDDARRPSGRG